MSIIEDLELSFFSRESNIVLATEYFGELKDVEEIDEVVADKSRVICLANGGDGEVPKLCAKTGLLSNRELFSREDFIKLGGADSTLFQALLVTYWSHQVTFPVNVGVPIHEPIIEVKKTVTRGVDGEEILDQEFSQDNVKCGPSIEIQNKERLLQRIERVLDGFCQKNSSKVVGTALSLELSFWLVFIPRLNESISDEDIQSFCHHRTSRNRTIRFVRGSVLVMTFEQNTSIHGAYLGDGRAIDIAGEGIEEEVEVFQPAGPAKL